MKKMIILALAALALSGCEKAAESTVMTGSEGDFKVARLFTVDDCTAYRFYDNGRAIYYTNCSGQVNSKYSCGKNCTREDVVSTGYINRK